MGVFWLAMVAALNEMDLGGRTRGPCPSLFLSGKLGRSRIDFHLLNSRQV